MLFFVKNECYVLLMNKTNKQVVLTEKNELKAP